MTSTIEDRAREVATHLLARGFPTGPLIDNTSTVADTLTTFAKAEVEKAMEEAAKHFQRKGEREKTGAISVISHISFCEFARQLRALKEGNKP